MRLFVFSVRLYSTLTGISSYCFLSTSPSDSSSFNELASIVLVMPCIERRNSPYRTIAHTRNALEMLL